VPASEPIDLFHGGAERQIGCYLLETADGPALLDCGPASCLEALERGLRDRGVALTDLRHLLLSHIHLDHAGAAGSLVRRHPALQVQVSAIGAPHVVDPSRLERSARRLYGDTFDPLWGELAPVPEQNVHVVGDRVLDFEVFPSPGHASHHACYIGPDGTLYTGDAAGVRLSQRPYVLPPTPPPDIDLELWERTIDEIEGRRPERLALIHFGVFEDVDHHLSLLRDELRTWAERVRTGLTEDEFVRAARSDLQARVGEEAKAWEGTDLIRQSHRGLARYWEKRAAPTA
jgi:glyoxylase-like metal-dependent hydrolase (beta-lactamase superfamily II)